MSEKGKRLIGDEEIFAEMKRLLDGGSEVIFTPKGLSMLPFIRGGKDSVALHKVPPGEIQVGDVVLAEIPPKRNKVMHRVFKREGDELTLMGDGNIRGTESCSVNDVMGKVTDVLPCKDPSRRRPLGKGKLWKALLPFRRYILAIYRRLPWIHISGYTVQ